MSEPTCVHKILCGPAEAKHGVRCEAALAVGSKTDRLEFEATVMTEALDEYKQVTARQERIIVLPEANSGFPLKGDFERMARRRFQDPKPKREGKWWYLRLWQDVFVRKRKN